jgi:hypothetical protein
MLELEPAATCIAFQELEAWSASAFECESNLKWDNSTELRCEFISLGLDKNCGF